MCKETFQYLYQPVIFTEVLLSDFLNAMECIFFPIKSRNMTANA